MNSLGGASKRKALLTSRWQQKAAKGALGAPCPSLPRAPPPPRNQGPSDQKKLEREFCIIHTSKPLEEKPCT